MASARFGINVAVASVVMMHLEAILLLQTSFDDFVSTYNRDYAVGSPEYLERFAIFQERVRDIEAHNAKSDRRWTAGISHLTDRTDTELSALYGWRRVGKRQPAVLLSGDAEVVDERDVVDSIDWTNLSMASNVHNQGACGSCWAVATVVMLEANHESQKKLSRTFSIQQLVDCTPNPKECGGQGGCKGATVELAMTYAQDMGLEDEAGTPYVAKDTQCKYPVKSTQASFLGTSRRNDIATSLSLESWHTLPENKAKPLMTSLLDGPVAVSVGADQWSSYSSGVFDGCSKDTVINHAVVLFGYGQDDGGKYWKIRNSWGSNWGENGYIRLLRHNTMEEDNNFCGTDNKPEEGIACKPYPEAQTVCGMCGILFDSVAVKFYKDIF